MFENPASVELTLWFSWCLRLADIERLAHKDTHQAVSLLVKFWECSSLYSVLLLSPWVRVSAVRIWPCWNLKARRILSFSSPFSFSSDKNKKGFVWFFSFSMEEIGLATHTSQSEFCWCIGWSTHVRKDSNTSRWLTWQGYWVTSLWGPGALIARCFWPGDLIARCLWPGDLIVRCLWPGDLIARCLCPGDLIDR